MSHPGPELAAMSVLCTNCLRPVDAGSIAPRESHSWCPHCNRVFRVPLFYVPEWIFGVMAILVANLHCLATR